MTAAAVLGVLVGSAVGSALSHRVHARSLRKWFAVLLAVVAVQMLRRALVGGGP
jgi:uncharacterized membrane protein YfcA